MKYGNKIDYLMLPDDLSFSDFQDNYFFRFDALPGVFGKFGMPACDSPGDSPVLYLQNRTVSSKITALGQAVRQGTDSPLNSSKLRAAAASFASVWTYRNLRLQTACKLGIAARPTGQDLKMEIPV